MTHGESLYEIHRDRMKQPDIWYSENDHCPPHYHSALEIVYVTHGALRAFLNGEEQTVRAGQALVVSSHVLHRYDTPEASRAYILLVPVSYVAAFRESSRNKRFAQTVLPAGHEARRIGGYLADMLRLSDAAEADDLFLRGMAYAVVGLLTRLLPMEEAGADTNDDTARHILDYLHSHFAQPLSLDSLARRFGYSRSRFSCLFNRHIGCSLPEYVNMLRARKAAELLRESGVSVTEAALAAGFESERTFYRAFQSQYGVPPLTYRRRASQAAEGTGAARGRPGRRS